ncbi:FAD-dependent oxidoreductase [Ginsengibacter hankyongi]|uniref:Tryptophan 2-monooxygenase n=1 Tax=Ginsengibacter hankyongi TaxID=2607284 RepID=A0A5J5IJU5_9BACT|nr:NAD(P)/FAD-dependent oxidoreductase [Ginsengibacter hankyongi]KAA9041319.1 FAD-dependent oxidoreductase [Ginsengibacter hankyongi]
MYDVIIIGGGAAGLVAAKLLSESGKKILLLEAKEKLGGRIHCIKNFSFPVEGGAEFIHGNLKTTVSLLKEAGLKKEKIKGNFCRVTNGKWNTEDEPIENWDLLVKKLKECKQDISVDSFLNKFLKAKKYDTVKRQFRKYIEGYDAADPKYANVLAVRDEMEDEDESQYRPVPGYYALINFLKETCLKCNGIIKTGEPVKEIKNNKNVEVITSAGKYLCKQIIITVPLGVLQSKKNNKSFIEFPSSIKKYIAAAKKIGNGGVIKFLLEFDKAFWLEEKFLRERKIPPPSYIFSDAVIPTWWTQYPHQKPLLTGWIAGPASIRMKNYSERKFTNLLLTSLSSIFSIPIMELEGRLKKIKIMNWIKEPHILGGYSYSTLQTERTRDILLTPFEDKFYFAGEFLIKNSSSTVDDALQSGILSAEKIINLK